jgi:hypothetical protein
MFREQEEYRRFDQDVEILLSHLLFNLERLPELTKRYKLSPESHELLQTHLQKEIEYLTTLPDNVTLKEIIDNHFEQGKLFRRKLTHICSI